MNYMLLMYQDESDPNRPDGCEGLAEKLAESGHLIAGGRLKSVSTATSVRIRDGLNFVKDGPFAETREQLAGYLLIKAHDLDEAISIANQHPVAKTGTVEIRPFLSEV
jgi:hypothetical protein